VLTEECQEDHEGQDDELFIRSRERPHSHSNPNPDSHSR
jgi:hypothetical protein